MKVCIQVYEDGSEVYSVWDVVHSGKCAYKCMKMAAKCILFVVECYRLCDFVPEIFSEGEHGHERPAMLPR